MKSVRPTATSADHGTAGRGRTTIGAAAIAKRRTTSWDGEKLSRPMRVATKATPQTTATSTASAACAGRSPLSPSGRRPRARGSGAAAGR